MQPDIIDRLLAYAEASEATGLYTEAKCAYDAIEEIQKLREDYKELLEEYSELCDKYNMLG